MRGEPGHPEPGKRLARQGIPLRTEEKPSWILKESQVQGAAAPCRVQGSALALTYAEARTQRVATDSRRV